MSNVEINIEPPRGSSGVVEIRGGGHRSGVIAIVVCVVIVTGLVAAFGPSRGKSFAEPATTTTVVAPSTTTTDASTTTTISASTTTTTAEPETLTTVAPVQVYGPLLPEKTGTTLLTVQRDGQLVRVDIDSGTVTNLAPGQRFRNVYDVMMLRHGGVVLTGNNVPRLVADGAISNLGSVDQIIGTADGVRVIGVRYDAHETNLVIFAPGDLPDPSIRVPAQSDPAALLANSIVLQARAGGVYRLDLGSGDVHKIADGIFVAAEGNRIASMTCDAALQCRIGIGPMGGRPTHNDAVAPDAYGNFGLGGALSPTRDLLALQMNVSGRQSAVVLDLDTGIVVLDTQISSGSQAFSPFVWSADGRWLFWVDVGQVRAWSPDRGGEPIAFANAQAGSADLIAAGSSP
jgi:hypothetical protein